MPVRSTGKAGIGVRLLVLISGTFHSVANVTTMSVGGTSVNMIDATHLDSPNKYSEFIAGLKSGQEWTLTIQWNPAELTHDAVTGFKSIVESRLRTTFRMDPSQIGFLFGLEAAGYVSSFGNANISPDGIITRDITFRPTGPTQPVYFGTDGLLFNIAANSGYLALI